MVGASKAVMNFRSIGQLDLATSTFCENLWFVNGCIVVFLCTLLWHHNGHDGVSNLQLHECLLNRLFRRRSKKTPKLRVTYLCAGNSPVTSEFSAQMASNAENVSIWWRHHEMWHMWQLTWWLLTSQFHQLGILIWGGLRGWGFWANVNHTKQLAFI